jgi:hypothetical protein
LKAAAEYEKVTDSSQELVASTTGTNQQTKIDQPYRKTRKGFGGSAQFVFDPYVEFGVNAAYGKVFETDQDGNALGAGSYTSESVGGFANLRLARLWLLGLGLNWTTHTDSYYLNGQGPDYTAHLQGFLAVQYLLAGQLFIKAVLGYARADFEAYDAPSPSSPIWSSYMYSGRVRLMYLY